MTPTGTAASAFVTLLQNGKPARRTVTTGAVGTTRTEITDGLAAGDTVVLADTGADVPASSTTSGRTTFGGPGGGLTGGFTGPGGGMRFGGGGRP